MKSDKRRRPTWTEYLPRYLAEVRPSELTYFVWEMRHRFAGIHPSLSRKIVDAMYFIRSEPNAR